MGEEAIYVLAVRFQIPDDLSIEADSIQNARCFWTHAWAPPNNFWYTQRVD